MKAGQLIAVIESDDLTAARKAAEATVASNRFKLERDSRDPAPEPGRSHQRRPSTPKRRCASQRPRLAQAQANLEHQKADTTRTVALAKQGIMSEQAKDEAVTSLQADQAAVQTAQRECRSR